MGEKKRAAKISNDVYEAELFRLQTEFVALQEWVRVSGTRVVVIFEGRDAAGKGGTIKRITEYLSPRIVRVVALPAPGEIVLLDRSWYNRSGVETVMGFCTPQEHSRFLRQTPIVEQMLIDDGIIMRKYWFSVSDGGQLRRFRSRMNDPVRQWKLSPRIWSRSRPRRGVDGRSRTDHLIGHVRSPEAIASPSDSGRPPGAGPPARSVRPDE